MPIEPKRSDCDQVQDRGSLSRKDHDELIDQDRQESESFRAPEAVRLKTIQVLGERIRLLGINRSGAYEHYNLQLENGFPIPPGELAICDLIRSQLSNLRSYHEIGSGLGTLPLMLAHDGFAAVGIERDERRHLTALAISRELSTEFPQVEQNCRLIGAAFPDAVADLDVSDSVAIFTDFVSSQAAADYIRLCRTLSRYRYVLLDLQRFCKKRDSEAEQDQLVEELASYGLVPRTEIIDLESQGYYRLFEGRPERQRTTEAEMVPPLVSNTQALSVEASIADTPLQSGGLAVATARHELQVQGPSEVAISALEAASDVRSGVLLPPMPRPAQRKRFGGLLGLSALLVIGIPSFLAVVYFGFIASSQYVTSFQFAVRGPSQTSTSRGGGASAMGLGAMSPDSFVVTDYINSPQAIADVERSVDLQAMFSKADLDYWSRLPSNPTAEVLKTYWSKMVAANFDLISGNVLVSVRAFTPQDSLKLAQTLVATSDEMFRKLNAKAQQDIVRLADENLDRARQKLAEARQALLVFREGGSLVDPGKTAQAGADRVEELRKKLSMLRAQYASIESGAAKSPMLAPLRAQISALEAHISREDRSGAQRVTSPETMAEYQSLELERQYADKQYTDALEMRNQAYLTAQAQLSYLALFAPPMMPQTSLYPNRPRAIAAVVLGAAAAWFVGMLIAFALRDHLM